MSEVNKFVIYKCSNGWLLNVHGPKGFAKSFVYCDIMKILSRVADYADVFDEESSPSEDCAAS